MECDALYSARFASKLDLSFPGRQTYRHLCICMSINVCHFVCLYIYIYIYKAKYCDSCSMTAYHYDMKRKRLASTSVTCQKMQQFPTLSHEGKFSKMLLNIKCVFWFSLQTVTRIERNIIKNEHNSSLKYPLLQSDIN